MDALIVGAVVTLIAAALSAWTAWYGARIAARPQREGVAVTGLTSLTDQLQEERTDLRQRLDRAEQERDAARRELGDVRSELAAERIRCATLETECATLRTQLASGGTP